MASFGRGLETLGSFSLPGDADVRGVDAFHFRGAYAPRHDCGVDSVYLAPIFGLSSAAVFLGECLGDLATGDSGILPVASILILKGNTSNVRGC